MWLRGSKSNRLMGSIGKMLFKKLRFSPRERTDTIRRSGEEHARTQTKLRVLQ